MTSAERLRQEVARILACCERIDADEAEEAHHLYVQATGHTACGLKVLDYPHYAFGEEHWHSRPACLMPPTVKTAESVLTCRTCLEHVRSNPKLLRQEIVHRPVEESVLPEYVERFRHWLSRHAVGV